ncbi:hypothetical protein [Bacteroides thetaiotaomicron]|uniref:hypothetical protein n=1 Tax=Bacteroides thetaiotaomicron TaxID=818 RepID=UPI001CE295FB|nr:hypothetical protein [Bacteroides thetaiotaomicron]MCA6005694.1 hypothetical protein [Bacteroides thetaiotaomicron]
MNQTVVVRCFKVDVRIHVNGIFLIVILTIDSHVQEFGDIAADVQGNGNIPRVSRPPAEVGCRDGKGGQLDGIHKGKRGLPRHLARYLKHDVVAAY